jgi:type I restriction enzyme S subunit
VAELPEGWTSRPVRDAFDSFSGGTPSRANPVYWGGIIPWLSSGDIKGHRIDSASESITKAALENSSAKLCRPGSMVVVVRSGILAHTLPVAILECPAAINQDIKCFDSGNDALNTWLALALRASAKDVLSLNREGTTVQSVKYDTLRDFELPIPPLAEQARIIAKIDELLKHVDTSRQHLGKVPKILKAFRQSVLAAACSGRLTEDWRSSQTKQQHTRDVLVGLAGQASNWIEPSFEIRPELDIPSEWSYIALGNLGEWGGGGTPSKSNVQYWKDGQIPWVSPKDMKSEVISDSRDHITDLAVSRSNLKLVPKGSLLCVVRGLILAHSFPVAVTGGTLTVNQDIRFLIPHSWISSAYLLRALQNESRAILFAVRESTHGTRRLESPTLKLWPIPVPPPAEQEEIVRRTTILFTLADKIASHVAAATKRADRLTQAVLAKAFRGELVAAEAELARREGRDYEPASILIERIRAQRNPVVLSRNGARRHT